MSIQQSILDYLQNKGRIQVHTNQTVYDSELVSTTEELITVHISQLQTEMYFFWNDEMNMFWLSDQTYLLFPDWKRKETHTTIYTVSDLHLEFGRTKMHDVNSWPSADILVLAGDIGNPMQNSYKEFLIEAKQKYKDVVFIAGNHEFYGCNYDRTKVLNRLNEIATETKSHFLHRRTKVIQNVQFIGATLWSLIDGEEDCANLRDFSQGVFKERIDYIEEFINDYTYLRGALTNSYIFPQVVITHHLPTKKLIHKRFYNWPHNSCFFSDILDKVRMNNVSYWFCGHTHEYVRTKYGSTTLVVNPVGYPNENRMTSISNEVYIV